VMINDVRKITTKNGDPMAFLKLEDLSGSMEGVVFPSVYPPLESLLNIDSRVILWAKVDKNKKDEKLQLIVEDLELVENLKMLMIELYYQEIKNPATIEKLKQLLKQQGDPQFQKVPVILIFRNGNMSKLIRFGKEFWVNNADQAVNSLQEIGFRVYTRSLIKDQ